MFKIHAGESLLSREREILRMINELSARNLKFVVVGGYAVATYRHRFSVDLDLVIQEKDIDEFQRVLKAAGYSLSYSRRIALAYGERFERYRKEINKLPVHIDLLINGLTSRATDASWGFDMISRDSHKMSLEGIEFLIPKKEMIIAMKIHSGRFSDVRDIVALVEDINHNEVKRYATKGDKEKLKRLVKGEIKILGEPNFADGFKGVFGAQFFSRDSVKDAKELLSLLIK